MQFYLKAISIVQPLIKLSEDSCFLFPLSFQFSLFFLTRMRHNCRSRLSLSRRLDIKEKKGIKSFLSNNERLLVILEKKLARGREKL